jgi:hypothetical protein
MRINRALVPIAALAMAFGSFSAEAQQTRRSADRGGQRANQGARRDDRSAQRADRSGNRGAQAQRQDRGRADSQARQRDNRATSGRDSTARNNQRNQGVSRGNQGLDRRGSPGVGRSRGSATARNYDRRRPVDRGNSYRYYAPRVLPRYYAPRRYYGSGGRLSIYFGLGSGYRYGSPYYGRVYGYRVPSVAYGSYRYYGDLRLKVSPRDAAVYVDGYYAGIVDDFDGFFQRLTLEAGPHVIEIEAPGLGSQVFDVYVDPSRTIDLHADLLR